jgi:hypothetical protein
MSKKEISFGKYQRILNKPTSVVYFKLKTKQILGNNILSSHSEIEIIVENEGFIYEKDFVWDTKVDDGDKYLSEVREVFIRTPIEDFRGFGDYYTDYLVYNCGMKGKPVYSRFYIDNTSSPFQEEV